MAKAKKDEVQEEVQETKTTGKKADQVVIDEVASVDLATEKDQTVQSIERQTPFGVEVWNPIEKRTVLKDA